MLSKCDTDGCTGHLGKFPDCQTEALWMLSMDSGQDETTGRADALGWFALFIMDSSEDVTLDDGRTVQVPAGNYILTENDQGFVWTIEYDTEAEARQAFAMADRAYGAWLEINEPDDNGTPEVDQGPYDEYESSLT